MRLIDKLKKKLKFLTWWNKNRNNFYLITMCPLALVHLIFSPFFPIAGVIALSLYLVVGIIAGVDIVINEGLLERKIENLKRNIDALQGVDQSTLILVEDQLKAAKSDSPTTKHGKEENKRLIQELIERKGLVERALEEKNDTNEDLLGL